MAHGRLKFTSHGPGIFFGPYRWRFDAKLEHAEPINGGTWGYRTPPGSVNSPVRPVQTLLEDSDLRTRMGVAGRANVETEFDSAKEGDKLVLILASTLQHD